MGKYSNGNAKPAWKKEKKVMTQVNLKRKSRLSRIWPKKKWQKTMLVIAIVLISVVSYFEWSVYREVESQITVRNPEGSQAALLIYHPGLTSFAHDIAYSFAEGLISNNWRVEITTASPKAPTQLTKYNLLVLCWPIYDLNPGPTITNYINRIGSMQGTNTIIITVAGGLDPFNCQTAMARAVQQANGTVSNSFKAFRGGTVIEYMRIAGGTILP